MLSQLNTLITIILTLGGLAVGAIAFFINTRANDKTLKEKIEDNTMETKEIKKDVGLIKLDMVEMKTQLRFLVNKKTIHEEHSDA